jgi:hypothetical protein
LTEQNRNNQFKPYSFQTCSILLPSSICDTDDSHGIVADAGSILQPNMDKDVDIDEKSPKEDSYSKVSSLLNTGKRCRDGEIESEVEEHYFHPCSRGWSRLSPPRFVF